MGDYLDGLDRAVTFLYGRDSSTTPLLLCPWPEVAGHEGHGPLGGAGGHRAEPCELL